MTVTRTERAILRASACGGSALLMTNAIGASWSTALSAGGIGALLCLLLIGRRP